VRAAGAAILGAAAIGALVLATGRSEAAPADSGVDFDVDAEVQLATNYYGMALANPETWSAGQLRSLEGLLVELGMQDLANDIMDMRLGLYGDTNPEPEPLPDIRWIPPDVIEEIADRIEEEAGE
jgi:hypothetical protein